MSMSLRRNGRFGFVKRRNALLEKEGTGNSGFGVVGKVDEDISCFNHEEGMM
jgi:hypothetical protein